MYKNSSSVFSPNSENLRLFFISLGIQSFPPYMQDTQISAAADTCFCHSLFERCDLSDPNEYYDMWEISKHWT